MEFFKLLLVGHFVAQWLRHCATNRKVSGSRPDEVNYFCNLRNPSGCTRPWDFSASNRNEYHKQKK
jgi:hypothetical protein